MESIQKIILISGIPSCGKTTFSWRLKDIFDINIIETDYIYFDIAKKLGINEIKNFPNCKEWWEYDRKTIHDLKVELYKDRLEKITDNQIIIEGFGLCFRGDRSIIKALCPNAKIFFLYKRVNYEQWLLQKNKNCVKLDIERSKIEYEDLMNMVQLDNDEIII
jgi:adenylate kinase